MVDTESLEKAIATTSHTTVGVKLFSFSLSNSVSSPLLGFGVLLLLSLPFPPPPCSGHKTPPHISPSCNRTQILLAPPMYPHSPLYEFYTVMECVCLCPCSCRPEKHQGFCGRASSYFSIGLIYHVSGGDIAAALVVSKLHSSNKTDFCDIPSWTTRSKKNSGLCRYAYDNSIGVLLSGS